VQIDQGATSAANTWVDLGVFNLGSGASVSLSNVTPDYAGLTTTSEDIAWSAAAFTPVSGPSWTYTAMGDSYSSGEGNPPYDPGTGGGCDRSPAAYGRQFAAATSGIGQTGIQHIACSGATIANLTTTALNGEQPQISQIYTGSKLVTLTIGGNDLGTDSSGNNVGFGSILTYCLTNQNACESHYNSNDGNNLYTIMDNSLKPRLVAAYQAIKARVPSAKIVAVTYPQIFQPGASCLGVANLPVPAVQFLISVGLYLDNTIIAAAKAAGINVLDERYAFLGHQICSSSPWVYPLDSALTPGEQFLDTSALFHPNGSGQAKMSTDLQAYWQAMQAGTAPAVWPQSVNPNPPGGWLPLNLPYGIPTTAQAQAMLATLQPAPTVTAAYNGSADYWGWSTRNGCITRYRVLQAQALTQAQWSSAVPHASGSGCVSLSGSWEKPYDVNSGSPTTPVRASYTMNASGIAADLPIDHFVARANAWASGAGNWMGQYGAGPGEAMLEDFANDMSGPELLTVSTSSNSSKQDKGPQDWMPANTGMNCAYVKMWIAAKWQWNLGLSQAAGAINGNNEKAFLQNILNSC
jgi:lysophospholipase L1-like esterase